MSENGGRPVALVTGAGRGFLFLRKADDLDMKVARDNRDAWVDARAHDRDPDGPEPSARPIGTFAGGMMVFAFGPTRARDGYEVVTMYPRPPENEQQGDRP